MKRLKPIRIPIEQFSSRDLTLLKLLGFRNFPNGVFDRIYEKFLLFSMAAMFCFISLIGWFSCVNADVLWLFYVRVFIGIVFLFLMYFPLKRFFCYWGWLFRLNRMYKVSGVYGEASVDFVGLLFDYSTNHLLFILPDSKGSEVQILAKKDILKLEGVGICEAELLTCNNSILRECVKRSIENV